MLRIKQLALAATLAFFLAGLLILPAQAGRSQEDVSLFYEALAPYGKWVEYGQYGPVWYPDGVAEDWRPYVNGRWVPTESGWVFETEEPWGWATYHYGNWLPTLEYGWVWAPGSTWYPSTVAWRANEEYVGWAPMPPPDYEPVPAYYPEGGYYPGISPVDLLTPFFWNFCPLSAFPLNFWQPFAPAFTFGRCGCLLPFRRFPFIFPRTPFLKNFFFPTFLPGAFFGFGPPFALFRTLPGINFNRFIIFTKTVNIHNVKNVVPPNTVLAKNAALKQTVPAPVLQGAPLPIQVAKDAGLSAWQLNRPDAAARPQNIPALKAEIPKAFMLPSSRSGLRVPERPALAQPPVTGLAPRAEPVAPGAGTSPVAGQVPASRRARMIESTPGAMPRQVPIVQPGPRQAPQAQVQQPLAQPEGTPSRRMMRQERLQEMETRQQMRQQAVRQQMRQMEQPRQLRAPAVGKAPVGKAAPSRPAASPSPGGAGTGGKGVGGPGWLGRGVGGMGLGR